MWILHVCVCLYFVQRYEGSALTDAFYGTHKMFISNRTLAPLCQCNSIVCVQDSERICVFWVFVSERENCLGVCSYFWHNCTIVLKVPLSQSDSKGYTSLTLLQTACMFVFTQRMFMSELQKRHERVRGESWPESVHECFGPRVHLYHARA